MRPVIYSFLIADKNDLKNIYPILKTEYRDSENIRNINFKVKKICAFL